MFRKIDGAGIMMTLIRQKSLQAVFILILLISCNSSYKSSGMTGNPILSWEAPTTTINGQPLTNLEGYKIYYGTAPGSYSWVIDVGNVNTYEITGLDGGYTYYFVIAAYNYYGEGGFSPEVSRQIGVLNP